MAQKSRTNRPTRSQARPRRRPHGRGGDREYTKCLPLMHQGRPDSPERMLKRGGGSIFCLVLFVQLPYGAGPSGRGGIERESRIRARLGRKATGGNSAKRIDPVTSEPAERFPYRERGEKAEGVANKRALAY